MTCSGALSTYTSCLATQWGGSGRWQHQEQEGYQEETAELLQEKVYWEMTSEVSARAVLGRQELGCGG